MVAKDMIYILSAYLLGGFCTGYYLVLLKTGRDVRSQGSGGVGGRNVARVLGRWGFLLTVFGDALKGFAAIFLARYFSLSASAISLVLVAVIAGHIWPLPLQFRGGRGIATASGAYLAFNGNLTIWLLGITLILMVFRRGFSLSGLAAFLVLPLVAYTLKFPAHVVAGLAGSTVIILFAHRERLQKAFAKIQPQREI